MYNKIFNKIVDSSLWMEPDNVRILFMMFIAIMDEDGFVNLAGVKNVAHRAIMPVDVTKDALEVLESPDADSSNPANEGRRIERVEGGWMVLNSSEYRGIATREHQKELNRKRVRRHRAKAQCNAPVTGGNEPVTPSEAEATSNQKHIVAKATLCEFRKRISKIFNRRESTKFSAKEEKMFKSLRIEEPDLALIERFHEAPGSAHRRGLETLLNNWNLEIDRANAHFNGGGIVSGQQQLIPVPQNPKPNFSRPS